MLMTQVLNFGIARMILCSKLGQVAVGKSENLFPIVPSTGVCR